MSKELHKLFSDIQLKKEFIINHYNYKNQNQDLLPDKLSFVKNRSQGPIL